MPSDSAKLVCLKSNQILYDDVDRVERKYIVKKQKQFTVLV